MENRYGIIDNEKIIKCFESMNPENDKCAYIPTFMLISEPYKKLTARQKLLCIVCEFQWYERRPMHDFPNEELYQDKDCFYFSWKDVQKYNLYTDTMHSTFYKDMNALCDAGFIEKVASGQKSHSKNVYRFSDDWKTRD